MLSKFSTKVDKIISIISLAFVVQIFISYPLWNPADRDYPMVTAWGSIFPSWDERAYSIFAGLIIVSLLGVAFLRFKRIFITLSLLLLGIAILQDISRLQAWVYQYMMMLSIAWWYYKSPTEREQNTLWAFRWIFVGTYIWSGFHKLNPHFANHTFVWLMQIFEATTPLADATWLAYCLAIFELLLGILLLSKRTQKLAVIGLIGFHIGILTFLIADRWNIVVYAWNIAMMMMIGLLFWKDTTPTSPPLLQKTALKKLFPNTTIVLLFGVFPFLQTFQLYPYNLSLTMYSCLSMEAILVFNDRGANCFSQDESLLREIEIRSDTSALLKLDDWATIEFETPSFPAAYTAKAIGKKYCKCLKNHHGYLELHLGRRWEHKVDTTRIPCQELLKD